MDREVIFEILDSTQRIDQATAVQAIIAELWTCLRRYGFTAGLITSLPVPYDKRWHEQILANNWPQNWYERYNAQGHYRHDPCAERARKTVDPFFWSELTIQPMAGAADIVMREAAEFGLREGLCVPLHSPFLPPAAVTVAGEHVRLPPATIHIVHAIVRHTLSAVARLQDAGRPTGTPLLSNREREILQWTGAGKTAWEISCILGISLHTVNTHLKNVRHKLGAANVAHSVVEALRRHEIQL